MTASQFACLSVRFCHHSLSNRSVPFAASIETTAMSEPMAKNPARIGARRRQREPPSGLPLILCSRCGRPIVRGQLVGPLFSAKLVRWSEHPVLSKPPVIRGIIPTDGSPGRVDMCVGDQLRQRAAMGGERERAELAAFEASLTKCIADALVAEVRKEADAHGVDVLTWLTRDKSKGEQRRLRTSANA